MRTDVSDHVKPRTATTDAPQASYSLENRLASAFISAPRRGVAESFPSYSVAAGLLKHESSSPGNLAPTASTPRALSDETSRST